MICNCISAREDTTHWGLNWVVHKDGTIQLVIVIYALGDGISGQMGRMNGVDNVATCIGIAFHTCNAVRDLMGKEHIAMDSEEFSLFLDLVVGVTTWSSCEAP